MIVYFSGMLVTALIVGVLYHLGHDDIFDFNTDSSVIDLGFIIGLWPIVVFALCMYIFYKVVFFVVNTTSKMIAHTLELRFPNLRKDS